MLAATTLVFLGLIAIGLPVAFAIGVAGTVTIIVSGHLPLMLVPQRMVTQLDAYALLAVPYFILAGFIMERGGISERLLEFANSLTRHWRGGLAQSSMVACIGMAGLSGSGVADISAIASVAVPGMRKKGYEPGFTAAVLSAGGFLGPIIPPSILMIIYGSIANVSIGALFVSGIVPGLLLGVSFMLLIWWLSGRKGYIGEAGASLPEVWRSFLDAAWALVAPIVLVGGIVSGIFTPTEAGAIAALYAFVVGTFVYRELRFKDYADILVKSGLMTGIILFILATAALFGWLLERLHFPQMTAQLLLDITSNPSVAMGLILLLLLAVGTVVEVLAAAIVLIPVLDPLGVQFGFDRLHFAFVIVLALQLGTVTPPMGIYLFIANSLAQGRLERTIREMVPFIIVMIAILLLIAFFPPITLFLPRLFYG